MALVNRPPIFRGFSSNLVHCAGFFWSPIIPAVVESIVNYDARDRNIVTPIVISKVIERLLKQREADCRKKLRFNRD